MNNAFHKGPATNCSIYSHSNLGGQFSHTKLDVNVKIQPKIRNKKRKEEEEYDVLHLDNQIKACFSIEKIRVSEYRKRIVSMLDTLISINPPFGIDSKIPEDIHVLTEKYECTRSSSSINLPMNYREYIEFYDQLKKLITKVENIESDMLYNKYISLTESIVEEYKQILSIPIKTSFLAKSKQKDGNKERKKNLQELYIKIATNFVDIDYTPKQPKEKKYVCKCGNSTNFEMTEGAKICEECGLKIEIISTQSSFKDVDRINLHKKYRYEKKSHFKECIMQYQGKQSKYIDPSIDDKANEWFEKHNLLDTKAETKEEKYSRVQKEHLRLFMSESEDPSITRHYEDLNKLFSRITGKPCPNISHLEEKLIEQFDNLVIAFLSPDVQARLVLEGLDRTNILNGQFVLKKLLLFNGHKFDYNDFPGLKTASRQNDHEDIYRILIEYCGMNDPSSC